MRQKFARQTFHRNIFSDTQFPGTMGLHVDETSSPTTKSATRALKREILFKKQVMETLEKVRECVLAD